MEQNNLNRNLKPRHVQMIAIGGSVGVGLFLGSSATINLAGPSVLIAYALTGIVMFAVLRSLGEMAVEYPVSGSFSTYAGNFISPLMGYITGWTYWFLWGSAAMAEITAVGIYMKYWFPDSPGWVWSLVSLVLITCINFIDVKVFGEVEFWFSLIKIVTIIALIVVGTVILVVGYLNHGYNSIGFSNLWINGGFFPKGIGGTILSLGPVSIAFIGIELVGVTAGEAKDPEKTLPSAIKKILMRISIFYIGSLFIIMSLFPWQDISTHASPFVLTFEQIGLKTAAGIINFVILTAALSACNSGIFSSGRMLLNLSSQERAPKFLGKLNKRKIPIYSVLFTATFMVFGVILFYFIPQNAFDLVISVASITGIFIWCTIIIAQIGFRKTLTSSQVAKLKYKSILFPYVNYLTLAFFALVIAMCIINPSYRMAVLICPLWFIFIIISYYVQGYYKLDKAKKDKIKNSQQSK